jgi:hypothetical protein
MWTGINTNTGALEHYETGMSTLRVKLECVKLPLVLIQQFADESAA